MPTYIRLTDYKSSDEKEQEFFNPENGYSMILDTNLASTGQAKQNI